MYCGVPTEIPVSVSRSPPGSFSAHHSPDRLGRAEADEAEPPADEVARHQGLAVLSDGAVLVWGRALDPAVGVGVASPWMQLRSDGRKLLLVSRLENPTE